LVLLLAGLSPPLLTVGPGIAIGHFLGSIVDFLIIALILFVAIRALQRFKRQQAIDDSPSDPSLVVQERLIGALDNLTNTLESRNQVL
jgi:large conductance mechanosensitive channel